MYIVDPSILKSIHDDHDDGQIRSDLLAMDYLATDVIQSTALLSKLLLMRWPNWHLPEIDLPNQTNTLYEQWIDRCRALGKTGRAQILVSWVTSVRGNYANYPIFLYNHKLWRSHELLRLFLTDADRPPYLVILFFNLFHQVLGISHTDLYKLSIGSFSAFAPLYKELMTTNRVWDWAANKKQSYHFYGGQTNTVMGEYDAIFKNSATGMAHFNREAAARFDIGGGFNTCEIERLIGCPFTSADIRSPYLRDYDSDLILRTKNLFGKGPCIADDAKRNEFLERQNRIAWLPFDVFNDSFPDAPSYAFTSTGFMTSTVRASSVEAKTAYKSEGVNTLSTSFHGLARVMEKVAQGKDVDLFTLQRASGRVYKYKTVFLQWRAGKLVRLVTTDDRKHAERWTDEGLDDIYKAIDPQNPIFLMLIS